MKWLANDVIKWFVLALCGLLWGISVGNVRKIHNEHKKLKSQEEATRCGLQALLRADIIRGYEKYTHLGYCPIYARDALSKEYESYHELGGNGTVTHLWEEIQELPTDKII